MTRASVYRRALSGEEVASLAVGKLVKERADIEGGEVSADLQAAGMITDGAAWRCMSAFGAACAWEPQGQLEDEREMGEWVAHFTGGHLRTVPQRTLKLEGGLTLEAWIRPAKDLGSARIFDKMTAGGSDGFIFDTHPGDALRLIVSGYTREAGVRSLERALAKVFRKVAGQVAGSPGETVTVDVDQVTDLLGRRRFHDTDIADRVAVPGVATGLAVTGAGGDVLFVEVSALPPTTGTEERSELTVTGQLGDVMKESARIALSYVRSHRDALGIEPGEDQRSVHVHFPAGAVPKDGPSAGITMTTALVSLFTGRNVKPNLAMTGEVTLQGRVLPIGGVKQKLLAAHRLGLTEVIIPARNEADLDDVPALVRNDLTVHLAHDVADVIAWALDPAAAA